MVDKDKILNNGGLRNAKEFVNRKILDLAGDFILCGYRVLGKVKCHQGGHELTNRFLRQFNSKEAFNFFFKRCCNFKKPTSNQQINIAVNA